MAANFVSKHGNAYNFGTFEADTPLDIEFDKPVKELRIPLTLDFLAGSTPEVYDSSSYNGEIVKFPNIGGYPIKFKVGGTADNDCIIAVNEYGDVANEDYFEEVVPPTP